jgi:hypothetical protein
VIADWKKSVSRAAGAARIADIEKYLSLRAAGDVAPVDAFYTNFAAIVKAAEPAFLAQHPSIGPLMLVGCVSATENYVRDVLAQVIHICPTAQEHAAAQTVSLGTVLWHGGVIPERGVFDHLSFASADGIRQSCKKFLGYEIKKNSPLDAALVEFDNVCELRHAIVHAGAVVAGKNALRLEISAREGLVEVRVGFDELQEAGGICSTLVAAMNSELFQLLAERWAIEWRKKKTWNPAKADQRFLDVWKLFRSDIDLQQNAIPAAHGPVRCRNLVKKHFKLT